MASSTYQRTGSNLAGTAVTLFFIASIISVTPALSLASETVLEHFWITNGEVRAVEESDGKVYLGGAFSAVGPAIGGVGIFDLGTGAIQAPYAAVRGSVHAIAPDASGGYYLGGDFLYVQGQFRQNAAHIDASGQLTAWNPEVNGYVYALAVSGSTVYMGGTFESVGGEPRTRLAAVDAVTGVPTSWSPFPESPGIVHAIFATPTTLYVGGAFSRMDFITVNSSAAFDLATGMLTGYRAPSNGGAVLDFALRDNTLYLAGSSSWGTLGHRKFGVVAVDPVTGAFADWDAGLPELSVVYEIAVTQWNSAPFQRTVWIGGQFSQAGGTARANLAAIDGTTGLATAWNPGASGIVRSLAVRTSGLTGGPIAIYAGGDFTTLGGVTRTYLGVIDPVGIAMEWYPEPNGIVRKLVYGSGGIRAGGDFYSAAMAPRENLAALDVATGAVDPWNPDADAPVNALLRVGENLYAGGAFQWIGGALRAGVAQLDPATGTATLWNANLTCPGGSCDSPTVNAIASRSDGSALYLGGLFGAAGGLARGNLAAVDVFTGTPFGFNTNANGPVKAIALREEPSFPFDVTVYAGGEFTTVNGGLFGHGPGGLERNKLAALDGATGEATSWDPTRSNWTRVNAVRYTSGGVESSGTVWVGGSFFDVGPGIDPVLRFNAAAFNDMTANPTDWDPAPNGQVMALLAANGRCYLGGEFTTVGGQVRNQLAAVDLVAGASSPWDPDAYGYHAVLALRASGGTVYAGGSFAGMSSGVHRYFAAVEDPSVSPVEDDARPVPVLGRVKVVPNPFVGRTAIGLNLEASAETEVAVYDLSGRLVRRIHQTVLGAGSHELWWDGRDQAGVPTASGVYFLSVRTPHQTFGSKILRLR